MCATWNKQTLAVGDEISGGDDDDGDDYEDDDDDDGDDDDDDDADEDEDDTGMIAQRSRHMRAPE